jgi:predicted MPP superfamily phosphohydrolase
MNNLNKRKIHIIAILAVIVSLCAVMLADAFTIAPSRYRTRYEALSSEKIPEQMDGLNVLFFSDLDYGTFTDQTRLNSITSKINALAPDVILFGGDLYDQDVTPDDTSNQILIDALSSLKADYGKFAVMGDFDEETDDKKTAVSTVLNSGSFEVLNNTSLSIHKGGASSITLVGLDNGLNGSHDVTAAYANVSNNNYVVTLCHTPDSADEVPSDLTDYFLAGHSHGGQAYYLFGSLYAPEQATKYLRGTHVINDSFTLDITNGVGNTKQDVRFLAPAEVVMYKFSHTEKESTPVPTASASASDSSSDSSGTPEATQQSEQEAADKAAEQSGGNE